MSAKDAVPKVSASEKLKALEDVKAVDWPTPDHQTYRDNENALRRRDIALVRALPQIIAVVEAAEELPEFFDTPDGRKLSFIPLLDVLDEALS